MHGLCRELFSQICCGFRIQLRVSGWPLFGSIMGRSHFTCLWGLYVSSGFSCLCSFIIDSGLVSFELKFTRNGGVLFRMRFGC